MRYPGQGEWTQVADERGQGSTQTAVFQEKISEVGKPVERIGNDATEQRITQENVVQRSADVSNAAGNDSGDGVSSQAQEIELLQVTHRGRNGSSEFVVSHVQMK